MSTAFNPNGALGGNNPMPVAPQPPQRWRVTFSAVLAVLDPDYFAQIKLGSGQTVNQTGGNAVIVAGTVANAETIFRSTATFNDSLMLKYQLTASQRIVNNNLFIELVDVIGDNLTLTINSATSISVTIPNNPFIAENVGQSMYIGNLTGVAATAVPGRYAIASVSGDVVNFTVAGWPASGSGTASLFGWNYQQILYDGTTATANKYDTQRRGWNSGFSTATINTTASPGHMGIATCEDEATAYLDCLVASLSAPPTLRATRLQNIPMGDAQLYLQIRCLNGSTAPASSTTFTLGFIGCDEITPATVTVGNVKPQTNQGAAQVALQSLPTLATLTALTGGPTAEDAATSSNPLITGGICRASATPPTSFVAGDAVRTTMTTSGATVTKPFSTPDADWQYAAVAGGIVNTTAVPIKAAAAAGLRNYVTGFDIDNTHASVATEVTILDGATVIWRSNFPAGARKTVSLMTPLKGTAATALNVACVTTGAAVYVNAQGYVAP